MTIASFINQGFSEGPTSWIPALPAVERTGQAPSPARMARGHEGGVLLPVGERHDWADAGTEESANLWGMSHDNLEALFPGSHYKTVRVNNFNGLHIIASGSTWQKIRCLQSNTGRYFQICIAL